MTDSFFTISGRAEHEYKESRSTFIAVAQNACDSDTAMEIYSKLRKEYHDAAHIPFAYRLKPDGSQFRFSDDGEPGGSGGRPLFDALVKHSVTDVVIAVVRYFGGVKLGVGGLKRAFFTAANACLESAVRKKVFLKNKLTLEFDYRYMSAVMKLLDDSEASVLSNMSSEKCKLLVEIRLGKTDDARHKIFSATNGSASIEVVSA